MIIDHWPTLTCNRDRFYKTHLKGPTAMSAPSLPSDVEQLPTCCSSSLPPDVDLDQSQEQMCCQDSDAETLPESVADSMDQVPSDIDMDMEDFPSPRVAMPTTAKVPPPEEIRQWLQGKATEAAANLTGPLGLELYRPPRVLKAWAARGGTLSIVLMTLGFLSFDILTGWNFDLAELRTLSFQILHALPVAFLYLSPPCTMFSSLQTMWNKHRMSQAVWDRRWQQAVEWVEHCMQAIRIQVAKGQRFMFEHPSRATSWKLPCVEEVKNLPGVSLVSFDMCAFGMTSPMLEPIKKRTVIMTNDPRLCDLLKNRQCTRDHVHRRIEGSQLGHRLSRWCQVYPPALCDVLASCLDVG